MTEPDDYTVIGGAAETLLVLPQVALAGGFFSCVNHVFTGL